MLRLDGSEEVISESEWPAFLKEQTRLRSARTEAAKKGLPALTATIRLPSGEVVDHYPAAYTLDVDEFCTSESGSHSSGGRSSGPKLDASALRRYRLQDDITYEFVLSFNGWESNPVEVRVSQGKATPEAVVFEMGDPSRLPGSTE